MPTESIRQASDRTGLPLNGLKRLIRQGKLPAIRVNSRVIRLEPSVVDEFIRGLTR